MGFQLLRIMPYEYPLAYRVQIAPASAFSRRNGAYIADQVRDPLWYSSASENHYFGWDDVAGYDARRLAETLLQRRPDLATSGRGRDWEYAGWLSELVSVLETSPSRLPIVFDEYSQPPEQARTLLLRLYGNPQGDDDGRDMDFPLPPLPPEER